MKIKYLLIGLAIAGLSSAGSSVVLAMESPSTVQINGKDYPFPTVLRDKLANKSLQPDGGPHTPEEFVLLCLNAEVPDFIITGCIISNENTTDNVVSTMCGKNISTITDSEKRLLKCLNNLDWVDKTKVTGHMGRTYNEICKPPVGSSGATASATQSTLPEITIPTSKDVGLREQLLALNLGFENEYWNDVWNLGLDNLRGSNCFSMMFGNSHCPKTDQDLIAINRILKSYGKKLVFHTSSLGDSFTLLGKNETYLDKNIITIAPVLNSATSPVSPKPAVSTKQSTQPLPLPAATTLSSKDAGLRGKLLALHLGFEDEHWNDLWKHGLDSFQGSNCFNMGLGGIVEGLHCPKTDANLALINNVLNQYGKKLIFRKSNYGGGFFVLLKMHDTYLDGSIITIASVLNAATSPASSGPAVSTKQSTPLSTQPAATITPFIKDQQTEELRNALIDLKLGFEDKYWDNLWQDGLNGNGAKICFYMCFGNPADSAYYPKTDIDLARINTVLNKYGKKLILYNSTVGVRFALYEKDNASLDTKVTTIVELSKAALLKNSGSGQPQPQPKNPTTMTGSPIPQSQPKKLDIPKQEPTPAKSTSTPPKNNGNKQNDNNPLGNDQQSAAPVIDQDRAQLKKELLAVDNNFFSKPDWNIFWTSGDLYDPRIQALFAKAPQWSNDQIKKINAALTLNTPLSNRSYGTTIRKLQGFNFEGYDLWSEDKEWPHPEAGLKQVLFGTQLTDLNFNDPYWNNLWQYGLNHVHGMSLFNIVFGHPQSPKTDADLAKINNALIAHGKKLVLKKMGNTSRFHLLDESSPDNGMTIASLAKTVPTKTATPAKSTSTPPKNNGNKKNNLPVDDKNKNGGPKLITKDQEPKPDKPSTTLPKEKDDSGNQKNVPIDDKKQNGAQKPIVEDNKPQQPNNNQPTTQATNRSLYAALAVGSVVVGTGIIGAAIYKLSNYMSAAKIKTQRATINQLLKKAESHDAEIGAAYNAAQSKLTLLSKQTLEQMQKHVHASDYAALCKLLKAEHKRLATLLNKNIVLRMALGFKHLIGMN